MNSESENGVPKVHPATREIVPDDPLELTGYEIPGDPELMLRLLVEEYARFGFGTDQIMQLARDPFYQGFHGLLRLHGEGELRRRVSEHVGRCGVRRVTTVEAKPEPRPPELIQLELPH